MKTGSWIVIILLLAGPLGASSPDSTPVLLDQVPINQLRNVLKGYNGDWRHDSDSFKGVPEPVINTIPADAPRLALPDPGERPLPVDFHDLLANRRSVRDFSSIPITAHDLALLLWSAQGVSARMEGKSFRTAPSAGGRYPLETHVVARRVEGVSPGLYRYDPETHSLVGPRSPAGGDAGLVAACYGSEPVANAAAVVVWSVIPRRTEWKYTYTSHRMIAMEAGHACQNASLAAVALGLGACPLLSYHQIALDRWLGLDGDNEFAMYLLALGKPATK